VQYVGVEFRSTPGRLYSYQYDGEEQLKVGDRVWVPENWINPAPSLADVVRVYPDKGSTGYEGELSTILGVDDDGS
jgi:hypothetical protein